MPYADELCTDCGLCCDGTLFSSVSVDGAGLATARLHRLPLLETPDSVRLELPCPALHGVLCGIYEERPESCADFACELRLSVDEGEMSYDDARAVIDKTRALREVLEVQIGATPWGQARREVRQRGAAEASAGDSHAELLVSLNELHALVNDYFW